jgi:hypothetical protein
MGCSKKSRPQIVEGGLYASPRRNEPGYNIIKVLKIDNHGYHIRVYSNVFAEVPDDLDPGSLFMVGLDQKGNNQDPGMGHLPIGKQSFEAWPIAFIKKVEVREEELEGYNMWKEAKGGYF